MGILAERLAQAPIPKMFLVEQKFSKENIPAENIPPLLHAQLSAPEIADTLQPGMRVALTAGSRGIANIALILRCTADFVKEQGAVPFIVPTMGSHGGATAEGQLQVLYELGITEESCGCPIISSMETAYIGDTDDGRPVYIDKNAYEADGIIVINRVKPHTGFRGPYESGLMKMMAIGLGKQYGAEQCHSEGFKSMAANVPRFGGVVLEKSNVLFGIALLENAYDETRRIVTLPAGRIAEEEPKLLKEAFLHMPRILVDRCDVLIVDEIGKNYSGGGMDPNVTGTWHNTYGSGGIRAFRVAVLDVSEASHGNAHGVGGAHATTRRLFEKIDFEAMYINGFTSVLVTPGRIPWIMENDKQAIQMCLATCEEGDPKNHSVVRIPNSLTLERIWLSESYYEEARSNPDMKILCEPKEMQCDADCSLMDRYYDEKEWESQ